MLKENSVTLLHFNGWPDLDVPTEPESIEGFNTFMTHLVEFYATNQGRAVVHCRGGMGITGTTVTILSRLLQAVHKTQTMITQSATLAALRAQRPYLCETHEQYDFVSEMVNSQ